MGEAQLVCTGFLWAFQMLGLPLCGLVKEFRGWGKNAGARKSLGGLSGKELKWL